MILKLIKQNAMYLLGAVCGAILAIVSYFIWRFLISITFDTKYFTALSPQETIFSLLALIGIATVLYLIVMLVIKLVRAIYAD